MNKILKITIAFILSLYCYSQKNYNTNDSLEMKIGQMIMVGFRGLEANQNSQISKDIRKYHLGGVVLFDYDLPSKNPVRNIQNFKQVKSLCDSLQKFSEIPLIIAIDQEGGRVNRLKTKFGFLPTVSTQYLGTINNLDTTKKYAESNALTLSQLGINVNFAPCVDLNINPDNPVIGRLERSFSADPNIVISNAKEIIKVHHNHNVFCTLKHFPGHGSSKDDSHLGFVDVTGTWSNKELEPYLYFIKNDLCDIIMTAHIFNSKLDQSYPATLSKNIITNILRDSLHFDGIVVSDDMQMKAIADHYGLETAIELAINAGVDIVTFANNGTVYVDNIAEQVFNIIKKLVDNGKISKERIEESYGRIMRLKEKL
jgi:beta-N-acetylhexosaminidase